MFFYYYYYLRLHALAQRQSNFPVLEAPSWLQQLLRSVGLQFYIVLRGEEPQGEDVMQSMILAKSIKQIRPKKILVVEFNDQI